MKKPITIPFTNAFISKHGKHHVKDFLMVLPYIFLTIFLFILPLIMVIVKALQPIDNSSIAANWIVLNNFIIKKILLSISLALISTVICIVIAYPFAYLLAFDKSKKLKIVAVILITVPIWSSLLIKLIGLKTFFDILLGYPNSTYGHIFTIIGLVYIYIPFMILPIYNTLNGMPKNIILASQDLGHNFIQTFFKIIIPYTKTAFFAGLTMVFLPAITTTAIPQFMNNSSNNATIGDIIAQEGQQGLISQIALARASTISIATSIFMILIYGLLVGLPKITKLIATKRKKWK